MRESTAPKRRVAALMLSTMARKTSSSRWLPPLRFAGGDAVEVDLLPWPGDGAGPVILLSAGPNRAAGQAPAGPHYPGRALVQREPGGLVQFAGWNPVAQMPARVGTSRRGPGHGMPCPSPHDPVRTCGAGVRSRAMMSGFRLGAGRTWVRPGVSGASRRALRGVGGAETAVVVMAVAPGGCILPGALGRSLSGMAFRCRLWSVAAGRLMRRVSRPGVQLAEYWFCLAGWLDSGFRR